MGRELQNYKVQDAISELNWNHRPSQRSKIKCYPFEIHFNGKSNTNWKQFASCKLSHGILDKRKSMLYKERALD